MHLTLIAPTYLPARRANTIQVMKMAQAILENGHQVEVTVPAAPGARTGVSWPELAAQYGLQERFPVTWLPAQPRLRSYDYAWRAVRLARERKTDAIYTRLPQAALMGGMARLAVVYEIHDLPMGRVGPVLFRRILASPNTRRIVFITRALAEACEERYPLSSSRRVIAADGVDLHRYQDLPDPEQARRLLAGRLELPARFTAGYTGHLYPGRGAALILALAGRFAELNFLIAGGEAGDVARLQQQIEAQSLRNVFLTGFVANAELPLYQAACEVLLMPYQRRVAASSGGDIASFLSPMKLFEYLASGRAILSSDLPVLREVLNQQNVVLLPGEHPESWVEALERLRSDAPLRRRLGAQAREDARGYSWRQRAVKILAGIQG